MGVLDDAIREHLDLKRRHGAAEAELRRQEEEALGPARREVTPAETDDGDGAGEAAPAEAAVADQGELPAVEAEPHEVPAAEDEPHDLHDAEAEPHDLHTDEPELSEALPASAVRSDLPEDEETGLYELPPEEADPEGLHEEPREEPLHEPLDDEPLHEAPPSPAAAEPYRAEPGFDEDDEPDDARVRAGDTPPRGFEPVEDDELLDDEDDLPQDDAGPDEATGADADVLEDTPDFLQETPEHDRLWFEQKPPRDFDFD
jgi:hypothetical protein